MCFPWPIKKKIYMRFAKAMRAFFMCHVMHSKKKMMKQTNAETINDVCGHVSRMQSLTSFVHVCLCMWYIYIYLELYMYMYRSCHMYLWFVRTKAIGTCTRSADLSAMLNWWILCIWHLRGGWVGHVHFPVQLMVKPRGSPAHRGQTAISGCIILGHSASACCYIRTLYFCEGFIVALALAVWFLYPHFDEWFFQCGHYWAHSA